ncbi:hypothetical protein OWR29_34155 [Actinoplanes sp. Pm04-4]|uniref:DUF4435 domain-containing protein n=1 Tax=Paractinoplanes pyxinae TaxID=2997416 RepID=A0ABT4B9A6_9ACTN|nr:hypothetical protein [Actinoplanes pyxinae]MCY1143066.1 hypothetical protein [Actinoplanes pyxinae]
MKELGSIIVDTSTLLNLDSPFHYGLLDHEEGGAFFPASVSGSIEALVLFDRVFLDGPSVAENERSLGWLLEIPHGVQICDLSRNDTKQLYLQAAGLFEAVDWSSPHSGGLHSYPGIYTRREIPGDKEELNRTFSSWRNVIRYLGENESEEVAQAFTRVFERYEPIDRVERFNAPQRVYEDSDTFITTVRHFYYLALQARLGGSLLLHPEKAIWQPRVAPEYGFSSRIFEAFDRQVHQAYTDRRRKWLGDQPIDIPFPLLTRFVVKQSRRRGWSIGRTVSWLREQPEVHKFRRGMSNLMASIDAGDNVAIDGVLSELDAAATQWSVHLGSPLKNNKISLQVALPLVQPAFDVPMPLPAHSPAQKMLVFIKWMLRTY